MSPYLGDSKKLLCLYCCLHGTLVSLHGLALCNVKVPRDRCESISTSVLGTHGNEACNKYSEQTVGSELLLVIVGMQKGNEAQIQIKGAPYR